MTTATRKRREAKVDGELLSAVEALARSEGQDVDALVDEALADLLAKHGAGSARPAVMDAYRKSHVRFAGLYKKLAE